DLHGNRWAGLVARVRGDLFYLLVLESSDPLGLGFCAAGAAGDRLHGAQACAAPREHARGQLRLDHAAARSAVWHPRIAERLRHDGGLPRRDWPQPLRWRYRTRTMSEPARRKATYEDVLAAPDHQIAEVLAGELRLQPRPAAPHAAAASAL